MFWLAIFVSVVAAAWIVARIRRTVKERQHAEEARAANLLAGLIGSAGASAATPAAPPTTSAPADPPPRPLRAATPDHLAQQKLLYESALKAGEAGEPALAIQLYARLLARYPASALAGEARTAVEVLKKKQLDTKP